MYVHVCTVYMAPVILLYDNNYVVITKPIMKQQLLHFENNKQTILDTLHLLHVYVHVHCTCTVYSVYVHMYMYMYSVYVHVHVYYAI